VRARFVEQKLDFEHVVYAHEHFIPVERLAYEILGSGSQGAKLVRRLSRHHEDRHVVALVVVEDL
jgi:hypothetical protein